MLSASLPTYILNILNGIETLRNCQWVQRILYINAPQHIRIWLNCLTKVRIVSARSGISLETICSKRFPSAHSLLGNGYLDAYSQLTEAQGLGELGKVGLRKLLMNYDTSIILIGNKSGHGDNKERRICALCCENKSRRQSFSAQIGQHWNRQRKAPSELEQAQCLPWQIFHQTCAHVKRQIGVVLRDGRTRQTDRRTDGQAIVEPKRCRAESVVSYDEDVRKLIHQTVQIRCQRTRATTPTMMTTSTGHVFNVARHDGWLWLWPTSRPIRAHCVDDHSTKQPGD